MHTNEIRKPAQSPLCQALILADGLHRDPGSGKWTILGTFSAIFARDFPVRHELMSAYAVITDGIGETPLTLRLISAADEETALAEAGGRVEFNDPRMVIEFGLPLPGIEFPSAGEYRLQLLCLDDVLMERRLMVAHAPVSESRDDL